MEKEASHCKVNNTHVLLLKKLSDPAEFRSGLRLVTPAVFNELLYGVKINCVLQNTFISSSHNDTKTRYEYQTQSCLRLRCCAIDKRTLKDSGHCRCETLSCCPLPIIHMMECVGKFKGHLPVKISYRIVLQNIILLKIKCCRYYNPYRCTGCKYV